MRFTTRTVPLLVVWAIGPAAVSATAQVTHFLKVTQDTFFVVRADLYLQTPPGDDWSASDLFPGFGCVPLVSLVSPTDNKNGPWRPDAMDLTPETAPNDTFLMGPGPLGVDFLLLLEPGLTPPCSVQGPAWADFEIAPPVAWIARMTFVMDAPYPPGFTIATIAGESATLSGGQTHPFSLPVIVPSAPTLCAGDLNGDGDTDQSDLGILLADYGCTRTCPGDLDGDGDTDQSDLGILLADYGCR
jgi:hypothetical protein